MFVFVSYAVSGIDETQFRVYKERQTTVSILHSFAFAGSGQIQPDPTRLLAVVVRKKREFRRMKNGNTIAFSVPKDAGKRREWIKYQLKIRGLSIAELAREHSASRQAVSTALVRSNPRWEHVIAEALDTTPNTLWPERYDPETLIPIPRKMLEAAV